MARSASSVMEVRSTGNDTNGGGFVTGASGTDWSQQDAAQYSVTDGVTAGTTTITSATANFGTDVVGNWMYVAGGTGSVVADWYEITGRTNSTTITVDRSTGLTAGTGVTLKIGGAFATIQKALDLWTVSGMNCWVKDTATYTITTGLTWPSGANVGNRRNALRGYSSTRGDTGRPTIQASAGSITMVTMGRSGLSLHNFIIDGDGQSSVKGLAISTTHMEIENVKVMNCTNLGIHHSSSEGIRIWSCELTNITGGAAALSLAGDAIAWDMNIHDNTVPGVAMTGDSNQLLFSRVTDNTGGSTDGIIGSSTVGWGCNIFGCVIAGNGRDGVRMNFSFTTLTFVMMNNIIANNGSAGIRLVTANTGVNFYPTIRHNAFYNNTSGPTVNLETVENTNSNVILTGDPFTNSGSDDYTLNNTSGAGAACRAAGFPGTLVGSASVGYRDIGLYQHQDAGGGGGGPLVGGRLVG